MLISFIIIFNIYGISNAAITYDCTNGTVYLNVNEVAFFETQNFPFLLSEEQQSECDLKFVLANNSKKDTKMVIAFYQFPGTFNDFPTLFSVSPNLTYFVQDGFPQNGQPVAEHGFVAFFDDFVSCPLEFLSKDKPYEILDESQILHIRSSYFNNQSREHPCHWKFVAPDGYGFKIVVQVFNISVTTSLIIENRTDVFINERSVKTNYPYYNSDNFLQITLTKGIPTFITDMEFQAYISIIKGTEKKTNVSCNILINENSVVWSNMNEGKGYENNIHCFYDLIISPKAVVIVNMEDYNLEEYIDYVKYYEGVSSSNDRIIDYYNEPEFVIESFKNDSDKHVIFEFVSDGSVQSFGFRIVFEFIVCECIKEVKCGTDYNHLMNLHGSSDNSYYCGNLNCSIRINKCSSELTFVQFSTYGDVSTNDIFKIISNNLIVFDIIDWDNDAHFAYLNSSSENILQAITHSSSNVNSLYFSVQEFEKPPESNIIFSDDNMTAIIDTALNPFSVVEMKLKNQFFILHCLYPDYIRLYTDKSLTTPIKYCFTENHPKMCIVKKNSFVINSNTGLKTTYATINLSNITTNCVFKTTTVFLTKKLPYFPIAAFSNSNGSCLVTILVENFYYITNLWTTSKMENIKVFVGIDQTKLYFEFNSQTQKIWKRIPLFSPVYTVLIPASSAIYVTFERTQTYSSDEIENIEDYQYKSIVASPDYGCSKRISLLYGGSFINYSITDYPAIFTVIDYTLSPSDKFYFQYDNKKTFVNKIGESFMFHNRNVSLFYDPIVKTPESGVLLLIRTYNNTSDDNIF